MHENLDDPDGARGSPFSEEALRIIAREKVLWNLGVKIHAIAYGSVNLLLFLLNLATTTLSNPWFLYVLAGWGVGFGCHVSIYLIYSRGVIGENRKALILHGALTGLAAIALPVFNLVADASYLWFPWPVGAGLVALAIHAIVYRLLIPTGGDDSNKRSWLDRKVDEEIGRGREQHRRASGRGERQGDGDSEGEGA